MAPRLFLTLATLAATIVACTAAGPGCPCGLTFDRDAISGEPLAIGADHDEDVHCICRCGDDPPERLPPSATCGGFEAACQTRAGGIAQYACE